MTQLELADVFTDTEKLVASKYGTGGVETVFYDGNAPIPYGEGQYDTPITFVRGGTAGVGYNLAEGMKVAVLNFADALRFGGWVEDGAPTQEEDLCRCTNLFNVLSREECHINYYAPNIDFVRFHRGREVYLDNIIYAKGITVFKDDTTYKEIAPRKFDVITCPAPATILRPTSGTRRYADIPVGQT